MLGRRDVLKRIEAEVQDYETRHAGVLRRLDAAATEAEQAIAAQRHLLTAQHVDAAAARKAADACRLATDRRAALEDAGRSLHADLEHARGRLAAERDRRFRESAAAEVEVGAEKLEAAAAELSRAAVAFDQAREKVASVCRDHCEKDILGNDARGGIFTAAARQAGILPRTSEQPWVTLHLDAVPAAAETVEAMRTKARAIRAGAMPVVKPGTPDPVPAPSIAWPVVRVVLARAAVYRGSDGRNVQVMTGGCDLPEPVAARAIEMGIGFQPQSDQARQILGILAVNPAARIEANGIGGFRGNNVGGIYGRQPELPPANLGALPDVDRDGVFLAEAAQ